MLRPRLPPAPRRRALRACLRTRLTPGRRRTGLSTLLAVLQAALAALAAAAPVPAFVPGQIVFAARPTSVRTRGGGNLAVDLPRGRALRVVAVKGPTAILEPSGPDADLLRQFGVRKIPRYGLPLSQLASDFLAEPAWTAIRDQELSGVRRRWPDLAPDRAERIFAGDPWIGMTREQADAAVGACLFSRETRATAEGREEVWRIGRRPRPAELRQFTEGAERGVRAQTFDDYLVLKTRALLHFRDGILVAIEAPGAGG